MWVSKAEKERLETELRNVTHDRNMWKAKYEALKEDKISYVGDGAVVISYKVLEEMLEPSRDAEAHLDALRSELESWKQKYADEVQKRLALIEQLGNAQTT